MRWASLIGRAIYCVKFRALRGCLVRIPTDNTRSCRVVPPPLRCLPQLSRVVVGVLFRPTAAIFADLNHTEGIVVRPAEPISISRVVVYVVVLL